MKPFYTIFVAIFLSLLLCDQQASAQASYYSQARPGAYGRMSATTNNFRRANSRQTSTQRIARLPMAGFGKTAPAIGGRALPPTRMDSFITNAGGRADQIYGDEGALELPPYGEFTKDHRINEGIVGQRDSGITTNHGSFLPDAWGNDEFLGAEWSQSGANSGNRLNQAEQAPYTVRRAPKFNTHRYKDGQFTRLDEDDTHMGNNPHK